MGSAYLRHLREMIGHELLLLPSVTILLFDERDRLLLVRHSNRGLWVAPGGMIEPDETPHEAALREMKEETGCEVELLRVLGTYGGPEFRVTYENGDQVAYVMTVYEARLLRGVPRPDGQEVLEARFVAREELSALPLAPWLPVVLADALVRQRQAQVIMQRE